MLDLAIAEGGVRLETTIISQLCLEWVFKCFSKKVFRKSPTIHKCYSDYMLKIKR